MDKNQDPLGDQEIDTVSIKIAQLNKERRATLPGKCTLSVQLEYTPKSKLLPVEVNTLANTFKSTYRKSTTGTFDAAYYINGDVVPFYVFGMDGSMLSVIEPTKDGSLGSIINGGIEVVGIRTVDRANNEKLCRHTGVTPEDEKSGNNIIRGSVHIRGEQFLNHETIMVEQLGIFISKNPNAMNFVNEDNSARTLRHWISSDETLINTDILYKLVVFVNDKSTVNRVYSTADGKLIDRAYVIKTPVVPSGLMYCRINAYKDDYDIRTKVVEVSLSDLDREGGIAIDHTLVVGLTTDKLRNWCIITKHELRHVTLAESECDDFYHDPHKNNDKSISEKLRDAEHRINELTEEVEMLNDTIERHKRSAHEALNEIGKPTTSHMRGVCKCLEDITEGRQIPKRKRTFKERLSSFAEYSNAIVKGIDGTHKAILGIISVVTVVAGLIYKFRPPVPA